jgi:biopolymer transport protein ExbB
MHMDAFNAIVKFFQEGGMFMYPIMLVLALGVAMAIERYVYLATFANIATLLGLLGTIIGLIQAFTAVANANPADKADLLSASISVAMNTTAFGLMAAIPLLLMYTVLQTKTTELVDSMEMATVKFLNAITEFRKESARTAD